MEVPNKKTRPSRDLWLGEVVAFKEVIEKLSGNKVTADKLARTTKLVNDRHRALQRLYNTRKARPVPISGKDALGKSISEIGAYAVGARYLYPDCRTVIDVGGQDSNAILLRLMGMCKNLR